MSQGRKRTAADIAEALREAALPIAELDVLRQLVSSNADQRVSAGNESEQVFEQKSGRIRAIRGSERRWLGQSAAVKEALALLDDYYFPKLGLERPAPLPDGRKKRKSFFVPDVANLPWTPPVPPKAVGPTELATTTLPSSPSGTELVDVRNPGASGPGDAVNQSIRTTSSEHQATEGVLLTDQDEPSQLAPVRANRTWADADELVLNAVRSRQSPTIVAPATPHTPAAPPRCSDRRLTLIWLAMTGALFALSYYSAPRLIDLVDPAKFLAK